MAWLCIYQNVSFEVGIPPFRQYLRAIFMHRRVLIFLPMLWNFLSLCGNQNMHSIWRQLRRAVEEIDSSLGIKRAGNLRVRLEKKFKLAVVSVGIVPPTNN